MDENKIDQVIASLSKIEESAVAVQQAAEREKAEYTKSIESQINKYDEELEQKTNLELENLSKDLAEKHQKILADMRTDILNSVAYIDDEYEKHHEEWAREIFEQIIKE